MERPKTLDGTEAYDALGPTTYAAMEWGIHLPIHGNLQVKNLLHEIRARMLTMCDSLLNQIPSAGVWY